MKAIIPARHGSKGVIRKNLAPIGSKRLIDFTIEAGLRSQQIDQIVVTSDADEVLDRGRQYGVNIRNRPTQYATDDALIDDVILDVINHYDWSADQEVILLQPTSPLRNERHIDEAYSLLGEANADGVISVIPAPGNPYKAFRTDDDGLLKGLVDNCAPFKRRQDCPMQYFANGAIYIFRVNNFVRRKCLLEGAVVPYIMSETDSLDIDTESDLEIARRKLCNG
ncbi:acylneuraminate cytidylyltransferase family protein [Spiribacter sp. 218]|uniref:acylneuraminate cytidylyltransferase family protein n=1 Tax=Spiribacter pallidus TaxID=1987936 RepID=UPI00349F6782